MDYLAYLSSAAVLNDIDTTTKQILKMNEQTRQHRRKELLTDIDGQTFFPINTWPRHLQQQFIHTPIRDTPTFQLLLFFTCNGGSPITITEWILTSYIQNPKMIKKRQHQIRYNLRRLKDKKCEWYYHDLTHNRLLFLNKQPYSNLEPDPTELMTPNRPPHLPTNTEPTQHEMARHREPTLATDHQTDIPITTNPTKPPTIEHNIIPTEDVTPPPNTNNLNTPKPPPILQLLLPTSQCLLTTNRYQPYKNIKNKLREAQIKDHKTKFHEQAVTNLSSYTLTPSERKVLELGLSFSPTYKIKTPDQQQMLNKFTTKLQTQYFFRDKPLSNKTPHLHRPSKWTPPTPKNEQLLQFTDHIQTIPNLTNKTSMPPPNITTDQTTAITNLINNKDITIKRADKGGSIVIMDTTSYIDKALSHIQQPDIYKEQTIDHTRELASQINSYLDVLETYHRLDNKSIDFLTPSNPPRTSLFYFLPKIHKKDNPPRPIISGCNSPTDNLSDFITHFLTPLARLQPSYIQDTKHFLQILRDIHTLPKGAILVTADVSSLYTNIPHNEGIKATMDALTTHKDALPKDKPDNIIIRTLMEFILENNYFDFMDKHYLQLQGTAMGTKMAPAYANIFMAQLEKRLTNNFMTNIPIWRRYIDDIFFIWTGPLPQLTQFITYANSFHPTIKLTFEHSYTSINFLDVTVYIDEDNAIQTNIHQKDTDKHLLLHYKSMHPAHTKRGIIYSQALRYKRLISQEHILIQELKKLKGILIARDYPIPLIDEQINKAMQIPREQLLQNREQGNPAQGNPDKRLTLQVPFHPASTQTAKQIRNTWTNTITDPTLTSLWPTAPTATYTRQPNLKDLLIRTAQH